MMGPRWELRDVVKFAEWLRIKMLQRGLTQRQVAWRTGVAHTTVSRLLAGSVPTARTLARLGRLFDWPPFDVVDPPTATAPGGPGEDSDPLRGDVARATYRR